MNFNFTENTPVQIDGVKHMVRMENGMTGIGSRRFWIDNKNYSENCVRQTDHLESGEHVLYKMKWRDNPWSWVYIFIAKEHEPDILEEHNKWREPKKITL